MLIEAKKNAITAPIYTHGIISNDFKPVIGIEKDVVTAAP